MNVSIGSFINGKGQEIKLIQLDAQTSKGKPYKIKIGFKKAQIVIDHKEQIMELLKRRSEENATESIEKDK